LELVDLEVAYPDRSREAALVRSLHARPRPRRAALGPVDQVEVDLLHAEALEAPLRLRRRVLRAGVELRREEDVFARDAAVLQRASDARLVPVCLRGVDVAIAGLERPPNGVLGVRAGAHLPYAQAEERQLVSIG